MGKALAEAHAEAREVFEAADDALGFSISRLCFEGPAEELTLTANAQPAIVTTSVAALRVIQAKTDLRPDFVVGHSLGEYAALVAAGALRFEDAVRLVHLRGKFMQEAVPAGSGAMAALLGMDVDAVRAVCLDAAKSSGEVVSPANLNGGGQVVIAGSQAAVDEACRLAKARGAKRAVALQVSAPFHCALMQPAADRLAAALSEVTVHPLSVPVVSNVEAAPNEDARRVADLLTEQVTAPVRWEESVKALFAAGVAEAYEIGHGAVLAGLVKRIEPGLTVHAAGTPEHIEALSA
jgi:[acyl-carrier-protein] S-malonyltransferase